MEVTVAAVMGHYHRITREQAEEPAAYVPVFPVDPSSGYEFRGTWINRFERAIPLKNLNS